jgi:type II secretory pathway component PulJ
MASMSAPIAAVALALLAALSFELVRRLRALAREVAALTERVHELGARVETVEQDASAALAQADTAEGILLDKGVFDEEDLEEARARNGAPEPASRPRDTELN